MSRHNPDRWVIVGDGENFKVLGGWSGGYLDGDSWRLSSGLERIEEDGDYYLMHNYSGSVYKCHKEGEGMIMIMSGPMSQLEASSDKVRRYTVDEFNEIKNAKESDA
jgi:hypothetical protein